MHLLNDIHDPRLLRPRIAKGSPGERIRILDRLEGEIRGLISQTIRNSAFEWEEQTCLELSSPLTVLAAAMTNEPGNPDWPGRDRVFPIHRSDLLAYCSALSSLGFFPSDRASGVIDNLLDGSALRIPGIEPLAETPEDILAAAWESGIESARSKKRWREFFAPPSSRLWAESSWADSCPMWKTFVLLRHKSGVAAACRELPLQGRETPAGVIAIIATPKKNVPALADEWADSGWDVEAADEADRLGFFDALSRPASDHPRAIVVAMDSGRLPSASSHRDQRRSNLLGDLSDDQFNAIVEASL